MKDNRRYLLQIARGAAQTKFYQDLYRGKWRKETSKRE